MTSQAVLRGVVHGTTIELEEPLGLPDGQKVAVTVRPVGSGSQLLAKDAFANTETAPDVPGTPANARLRELAARHPPAPEWLEADEEDPF